MDRDLDKDAPTNGHVDPGISMRNGPMENGDSAAKTNGVSKRKASMGRSYKQESDSDDDAPLVRHSIASLDSDSPG